jgi:hypothetical protein
VEGDGRGESSIASFFFLPSFLPSFIHSFCGPHTEICHQC